MAKKRRFESMTEMIEFFKKTGAVGGKTRAANMTEAERSESARKASVARWAKVRENKKMAKKPPK
jgi:hypothetical protein